MRANCTICSDIFDEINPISAANCGHVYHSSCLTLWIGQSKTCPHCRARITIKDIHKLYFNFPPKSDFNASELENEVLNVKAQLNAKDVELLTCKKEKDDILVFAQMAEKRADDLQQAVYKSQSENSELRLRVKSASKIEAKLLKLEQMNVALSNDLEHLNNIKTIVNGTQDDAESILKSYANQSETAKQLATYCTCLKRELINVMESKKKLVELNSKLKTQNCNFATKVKFYEDAMAVSSKKQENGTPAKKSPLSTITAEINLLGNHNTPASSSRNASEDMDISPLPVAFNKTKFNMKIKTSSTVSYKSDAGNQRYVPSVSSLPVRNQDNNSVVRVGYNGLGGHSNFINVTYKMQQKGSLKRKV